MSCPMLELLRQFEHRVFVLDQQLGSQAFVWVCAQAKSGNTSPLQSGGTFMLGGKRDCYGGCTG